MKVKTVNEDIESVKRMSKAFLRLMQTSGVLIVLLLFVGTILGR